MGYQYISEPIIRVPSLPGDIKLWNSADVEIEKRVLEISKEEFFREAILVASESLYDDMIQWQAGRIDDPKKEEKIKLSLLEYYIRMSSRTTPFGVFANIMLSDRESGESLYQKENGNRILNIDYEWVYNYTRILEMSKLSQLKLAVNNMAYYKGKYICVPYVPGKKNTEVKIKCTDEVNVIMEAFKGKNEWIEYRNLFDIVQKDEFMPVVKQLVIDNILITNLMPMPENKYPLDHILSILGLEFCNSNEGKRIAEISKLIHLYNENNRTDEDRLKSIICKLRSVMKSNKYIQLDIVHDKIRFQLSEVDYANILEFVNIMVWVSSKLFSSYSLYDEYKELFYERYGEYREVKLVEMLDDDYGIGMPQEYVTYRKKRKGVKRYDHPLNESLLAFFVRKYRHALINHTPIIIDEEDIKCIGYSDSSDNAFPILSAVAFECKRDSKGNNILYFNNDLGIGNYPNNIWGRFTYGSDEFLSLAKKINKYEEQLIPSNSEMVQLKYIPDRIRWANVMRCSDIQSNSISMYPKGNRNMTQPIIENIVVGIKNEKFYLKNASNGNYIHIRTNNMFHYCKEPDIIRFLKEVDKDNYIVDISGLLNNVLFKLGYLPQLQYKNIVIASESWYFNQDLLSGVANFNQFQETFQELIKTENIQDKVYLCVGDSKQLINIKHSWGLRLIYNHWKKYGDIILKSAEQGINLLFDENGDSYKSEVILPLYLKKDSHIKEFTNEDKEVLNNTEKFIVPGEEWLCFKVYGIRINTNEYISKLIGLFEQYICFTELFDKFFYVRYKDSFNHIRFRVHIANIGNFDKAIHFCLDCLNKQIKNKEITYFDVSSYTQEVERYGGYEAITYAETVFYYDSLMNTRLFQNNFFDMSCDVWGVYMVIFYLKASGLNLSDQYEWLNQYYERGLFRKEFNNFWKKNKELFVEANMSLNIIGDDKFGDLLNILKNKIEEFSNIVRKCKKEVFDRAIDALIHMSFNRMVGMNRETEKKYRVYARHVLYKLLEIENHTA